MIMRGSKKWMRSIKSFLFQFEWIKKWIQGVLSQRQKRKLQQAVGERKFEAPNPLQKAWLFSGFPSGQFFSLHRTLKILVIKLDHLGDFLLAQPALRALLEKVGPCELDLVVGSWNLSLAQKVEGIHQIFTFDFFKQQSNLAPELKEKALSDFLAQLPAYDIAIDFRRFEDTRFVLAKLRASYKMGYESFNPEIDAALDVVLPAEPNQSAILTSSNQVHTSIQMLRVVEAIPFRVVHNPSFISPVGKTESIGIFPFAGSPVKEWGLDNFREFVVQFSSAYPTFSIDLYVSRDRMSDFSRFQQMPHVHVHGDLLMEALFEHAAKNQVIVSNDSFGAHLAYQVGASLVEVLSGVGPIAEFSACFGPHTILREEVPCSPCHISSKEICPYDLKCLTQIRVEQVLDAVKYHIEHKTYEKTRALYYFL